MGGKSSSSQTAYSEVTTTNLALEDVEADYLISGQNEVNVTNNTHMVDGGAIDAMESTSLAVSEMAARAISTSLKVSADATDNAMDFASNATRTDNQLNSETLIKYGTGSLVVIVLLIAAAVVLKEKKGK